MQPGTKVAVGIIISCVLTGILLTAVLLGPKGQDHSSSPESETPNTPNNTVAPPNKDSRKPILEVHAVQLWMDYNENAAKADQKYKDKWLKITGEVREINSDSIGLAVVGGMGDYPPNVICWFSKGHEGDFASAQKWKKFSLIGKCKRVERDFRVWGEKVVIVHSARGAD